MLESRSLISQVQNVGSLGPTQSEKSSELSRTMAHMLPRRDYRTRPSTGLVRSFIASSLPEQLSQLSPAPKLIAGYHAGMSTTARVATGSAYPPCYVSLEFLDETLASVYNPLLTSLQRGVKTRVMRESTDEIEICLVPKRNPCSRDGPFTERAELAGVEDRTERPISRGLVN